MVAQSYLKDRTCRWFTFHEQISCFQRICGCALSTVLPEGRFPQARDSLAAADIRKRSLKTSSTSTHRLCSQRPTVGVRKYDRFIRGLQMTIQPEVYLRDIETFDDAERMALKYEGTVDPLTNRDRLLCDKRSPIIISYKNLPDQPPRRTDLRLSGPAPVEPFPRTQQSSPTRRDYTNIQYGVC